jgi:hypothetical protein
VVFSRRLFQNRDDFLAARHGGRKDFQAAARMLDVTFGQASDPGKVRTNNEDAMGTFIPNSRHQARSHG